MHTGFMVEAGSAMSSSEGPHEESKGRILSTEISERFQRKNSDQFWRNLKSRELKGKHLSYGEWCVEKAQRREVVSWLDLLLT